MPTVFVTGGAGFVGRSLITTLRERGDNVRAQARSERSIKSVESLGAEPVACDLSDRQALQAGMAGCEWVFHAATAWKDWGSRAYFDQTNVTGTESVLAAARAAGVSRLVYLGTEAVLMDGQPLVNVDETYPCPGKPAGLYALTRTLAEEAVLAANSPELATMAVRPGFLWGKGDTVMLPKLTAAIAAGQFVWIGDGSHLRSTIHIVNLCEGMILTAERGRGGEAYNLTDGDPMTLRDFITRLLQTEGIEPGNRSVPFWLAWAIANLAEGLWRLFRLKGTPPITRMRVASSGVEVTLNDAKARQELGYRGQMSIEAGLAEMQGESTKETER